VATINVTITEAHNVSIEGLGRVTGTVEYEKGYAGSLEQPPDPPELGTIQLRDAFGIDIPDEIWENGDNYDNLLLAVESVLPWDTEEWNRYQDEESEKYWSEKYKEPNWDKKYDEMYDKMYDEAFEVDYEIPF